MYLTHTTHRTSTLLSRLPWYLSKSRRVERARVRPKAKRERWVGTNQDPLAATAIALPRDRREMSVPDSEPATCLVRLIYRGGARNRDWPRKTPAGKRSASDFKREQPLRAAGTVNFRKPPPRRQKPATAQRVHDDERRLRQRQCRGGARRSPATAANDA